MHLLSQGSLSRPCSFPALVVLGRWQRHYGFFSTAWYLPFLVKIGREFWTVALVSIGVCGLLRLISPRPASKQFMAFGDLFLNFPGRFGVAFTQHALLNGADSRVHLALRDEGW